MAKDFKKLAILAARTADDKKADDIVALDLRTVSDVADYLVIATANSTTQLTAVYQAVIDRLKEAGLKPIHSDGRGSSRWIALDYAGFVVHLMLPEARDFYRLEQMWESPRHIVWKAKKRTLPAKKKKAKKK